jgi:rare lipoprotein A
MVVSERFAACALRMRSLIVVLSLSGLGACAGLGADRSASAPFMPYTQTPAAAATGGQTPQTYATQSYSAPRSLAQTSAQLPRQSGGRYKVGAPYQSGGVWYVPAEQPGYDETGLASWYGDAFDGKPTANGEIFDMNGVSAAHATLPMPCVVEVTNLDNGRTLQVRMNDRGPFHPGRIIDLSHGAADQLGFAVKGTARVRVRYVGPASLDTVNPSLTLASNAPTTTGEYLPAPRSPAYRPPGGARAYQTVPPARRAAPAALIDPSNGPGGGAGGFAVQAGAFSTRAAAERVASSLSGAGAASIRPMSRGAATLYRVTLGPWTDQDAAQLARSKVAALGFNDARIVPGS